MGLQEVVSYIMLNQCHIKNYIIKKKKEIMFQTNCWPDLTLELRVESWSTLGELLEHYWRTPGALL